MHDHYQSKQVLRVLGQEMLSDEEYQATAVLKSFLISPDMN